MEQRLARTSVPRVVDKAALRLGYLLVWDALGYAACASGDRLARLGGVVLMVLALVEGVF